MSAKHRRSKLALLAAGAALAAGAVMPAAGAATVGAGPSLKGLVLSGGCPGASSDLKNVLLTPRTDYLWAPLRFTSGASFTPIDKWIFPAEITVVGEGLKTRHLGPGETFTRPWPIAPLRPVVCEFDGATKEDGAFHVQITGTVVGGGSLLR